MKKVLSTIVVLSFMAIFGATTSFAQYGTRVDADIPFDFTIGKKTFASGKYRLVLKPAGTTYYSVSLLNSDGMRIFSTTALRNGSTLRNKSAMVFAVAGEGRYLETIKTPDAGFGFATSISDKRIAESKRVTVDTSGAPNFD